MFNKGDKLTQPELAQTLDRIEHWALRNSIPAKPLS